MDLSIRLLFSHNIIIISVIKCVAKPKQVFAETSVEQAELLAKLDAVQQALATLRQTFDDKIAEYVHKNVLFDNMHRELVRYQNGALDKIVDTIALDIIQLVGTTKAHVHVYEKKEAAMGLKKKCILSMVIFLLLFIPFEKSYAAPSIDTGEQGSDLHEINPTIGTNSDETDVQHLEEDLEMDASNTISGNTVSENNSEYMVTDGQYYDKNETSKLPNDTVIMGGVSAGKGTGYVSFLVHVPDTVHEEAYVYVANINSYKSYGVYVYEVNNYSTVICLPFGTYTVLEGGLTSDIRGLFYAENKTFTVKDGPNIVDITINSFAQESESTDANYIDDKVPEEPSIQENPNDINDQANGTRNEQQNERVIEHENKSSVRTIFFSILFITVPSVIVFLVWKKFAKHVQKGFDD